MTSHSTLSWLASIRAGPLGGFDATSFTISPSPEQEVLADQERLGEWREIARRPVRGFHTANDSAIRLSRLGFLPYRSSARGRRSPEAAWRSAASTHRSSRFAIGRLGIYSGRHPGLDPSAAFIGFDCREHPDFARDQKAKGLYRESHPADIGDDRDPLATRCVLQP